MTVCSNRPNEPVGFFTPCANTENGRVCACGKAVEEAAAEENEANE